MVRGGSLAEKIAADAAVFTDIVSTKLGSIETLLTTHGDGLVGRLTNHTREAAQTMEAQIATFEERAGARTGEIVSSLDGLIGRIDGTLEKHAGVFTEGLKARTIEVARAIAESGRSASAQLETTLTEAGKVIGEKTLFLSERADELNKLLGARSSELANAFDSGVSRFQNEVVGRLESLSSSLRTQTDTIHVQLGDRATEIAGLFNAQTERLSTTVDEKLGALGGHVADLSQSLDRQVNGLTQNIEGQLQLLDGRISGMTHGFDRQVHELSDRVDSRLELLGRRAADLADLDGPADRSARDHGRRQARGYLGRLVDPHQRGQRCPRHARRGARERLREPDLAIRCQGGRQDHRPFRRAQRKGRPVRASPRRHGRGSHREPHATPPRASRSISSARAPRRPRRSIGARPPWSRASRAACATSPKAWRGPPPNCGARSMNSTRHSIDALANAHETVRGEIGGILDRLSAANGLLQQIMSGAGQSLGALEVGPRQTSQGPRIPAWRHRFRNQPRGVARRRSGRRAEFGFELDAAKRREPPRETREPGPCARGCDGSSDAWLERGGRSPRTGRGPHRALACHEARRARDPHRFDRRPQRGTWKRSPGAFRELIEDSLGAAEEKARRIGDVLGENCACIGRGHQRAIHAYPLERRRGARAHRDGVARGL